MVGLTIVEPVPEAVEAMLHKIFGRSEVEPWVEFVDDTFKPNN